MEISTSEKFITVKVSNDFENFTTEFSKQYTELSENNIVIDFSDITVSEDQVNTLFTYAEQQAENEKSFVIIVPKFDADAFEEGLNVVPTLIEAEDIIDMDDMTRALDF